jgi:hypothetical protein
VLNFPFSDGDEEDGQDETIVPVDYKTAGQIIDDVSPSLNLTTDMR